MTTTMFAAHTSSHNWLRWSRRILLGSLIAVSVILVSSILTVAEVGLGGLISEKMLGRAGVTNSSLILGRTGTNTELSIMGFAPVVSLSVSDTNLAAGGVTTATLHANVTTMNGMPTATGYFQWGYSAGALTNTTPVVTITTTGDQSATITGFDGSEKIFYQFVTDADGRAYGAVATFIIPSGTGGYLLKNLLRVVLAGVILIGVIKLGGGNFVKMLIVAVIGLLAFAIVDSIINTIL